MLPASFRAMRPHQWVKNVFVFAAFGFALGDQGFAFEPALLVSVCLVFLAFSMGASGVYLLNDLLDVEADRVHPVKCKRPIASGELSPARARALAMGLGILALVLAYGARADGRLCFVVAAYMAMNVLYSIKLKHVVIVDVFCIATGFLLRVVAGGLAVGAPISQWLILCTLFLALFLGFNKRRAELASLGSLGSTRANLSQYSLPLLDQAVTMIAGCTVLSYALYTVDLETVSKFSNGERLIWSVPFVVFAILRYMYLVLGNGQGESPTRILLGGDRWFLLALIGWASAVGLALFG